jgi:hypothetical protein
MNSKALAKRLDRIEKQAKQQGHGFVVIRYITDEQGKVLAAAYGNDERAFVDREAGETLADFAKRVEGLLRASESVSEVITYGYGELH